MGSLIRLMAIAASVIIAAGFICFAADELGRGSEHQQHELAKELGDSDASVAAIVPSSGEEAVREREHGQVREAIDDANDVLLGPFGGLVDFTNPWAERGAATLLALLLYGVGLGMLANFLPRQRHHAADWRAAES
ncbi:MAG TPA: hypothetical protein VGF25_21845 [Thermoleophilaceae bacterium]|jgi:hypothetical protein